MKSVDLLCLLTIILNSSVFCHDDCITYDFEENFDALFTSNKYTCGNEESSNDWVQIKYSLTNIPLPHKQSTAFIYPKFSNSTNDDLNCVNSFNFIITSGAVVEILVYTENLQLTDQLIIVAQLLDRDVPGFVPLSPVLPDYAPGWTTLSIRLVTRPGFHKGNLTFVAIASPNSTILVDSFRYIPPSIDEQECIIYDSSVSSTTLLTSPTTEVQETSTPYNMVPPVTESTTSIDSDTTVTTVDDNITSLVTEPWTTKTTEEGVDITRDPESETNTQDNDITEAITVTTGGSSEKPSSVTEPWTTSVTDEQTSTTTEANDSTSPANFWIKLKLKLKMFMDVSIGVN